MPAPFTPEEKLEYLDLDAGLGRVRGNKTLYKKMLGMLMKSSEFEGFEDALQQQDLIHAADLAHGIKGMTGNLGLNRVYHLSGMLVEELRKGIVDEAMLADYRMAVENTRICVQETMEEL